MRPRLSFVRMRQLITLAVIVVTLLNVVAFAHAYRFTHFSEDNIPRSEVKTDILFVQKLAMLFTGIKNPRPHNSVAPTVPYQSVIINGTAAMEGWLMDAEQPSGTVVVFHGYAGWKAELLPVAEAFHSLGYRALSVDFPGSGGSGGNDTTIGYREALDVQAVCEYARLQFPEEPLILYGFSMGAAAIMRAVSEYQIDPDALILGCPFSTMRETVHNRFRMLGVPSFVLADLLVFWGGVQHGYWAFAHNPVDYAEQITIPTLLLYGQRDQRVTMAGTEQIYQALAGTEQLEIFEQADHELYVNHDPERWKQTVTAFLQSYVSLASFTRKSKMSSRW